MDVIEKDLLVLGNFTLNNEQIIISDPCYEFDEKYVLSPAKKGEWKSFVMKFDFGENGGKRCAVLHAYHSSLVENEELPQDLDWEKGTFVIPVDAGQVGIFSVDVFRNENVLKEQPKFDTGDPWYDMCCDVTLSDKMAGVVEGGVVSSSGWGDGGYLFEMSKDPEGKIQGLKVLFIQEEELDH